MTRARLIAACLLATACSSPRTPPLPPAAALIEPPPPPAPEVVPDWARGQWPAHLPRERFAAAVATSTDAAAALKHAQAALRLRLLGAPPSWPFDAVPPQLDPLSDPGLRDRHDFADGRVVALVAMERSEMNERLDAWVEGLRPQSSLPERTDGGERILVSGTDLEDPRDHLGRLTEHLGYRRAAWFSCQQVPVRTSTCAAPNPRLVQDALSAFLGGVSLEAHPATGVPILRGQGPLRPATVRAVWTSPGQFGRPLADIPIRFAGGDVLSDALTDPEGAARRPLPATVDPATPIVATVDAKALLGREATVWRNPPAVQIKLRVLDLGRVRAGLALMEAADGLSSVDGAEAFRLALEARGMNHIVHIARDRVAVRKGGLGVRLDLAEDPAGVDVVVTGEIESHFASQMSARSVWYEATGRVRVFDTWTGAEIGTFESTARAVGIGEAAAARRALEALAQTLAHPVHRALLGHYEPAMGAGAAAP